jgi:hypothetical protein
VNISRLSLSTIGAEQRIPLIAVDVQDLIIRDLRIQHRVPGVEDLQMTGVTNHQLDATIQLSGQVKK